MIRLYAMSMDINYKPVIGDLQERKETFYFS